MSNQTQEMEIWIDFDRFRVYVYSTTGYRAEIAADELNGQGFNAISIKDGYLAWKQEVEGR